MKSISKGCILPDGRLNVLIDSASTLTGNDIGDPSQVAPLLDQIEATIASVTAVGASSTIRALSLSPKKTISFPRDSRC